MRQIFCSTDSPLTRSNFGISNCLTLSRALGQIGPRLINPIINTSTLALSWMCTKTRWGGRDKPTASLTGLATWAGWWTCWACWLSLPWRRWPATVSNQRYYLNYSDSRKARQTRNTQLIIKTSSKVFKIAKAYIVRTCTRKWSMTSQSRKESPTKAGGT